MKGYKRLLDVLSSYFDSEGEHASAQVNEIDAHLDMYEKSGHITKDERDALRHYYGMRQLTESYGASAAWIAGYLNEGLDVFIPGSGPASHDLYNNDVAIAHKRDDIGSDLNQNTSLTDMRQVLESLSIPNSGGYKK